MANVSGQGTSWNLPNFVGELYLVGANATPFLSMIGGLQGGRVKVVGDQQFVLAQTFALEAAAQPAIDETTSLTAPTPVSYVRAADYNTCQIHQKSVKVSYVKQAVTGQVTADPTTGLVDISDSQPVKNERDFQIETVMKQISVDMEYTFLNGAYQQSTAANVAAKTRGVIAACSTNAVAAGSVTLDRALINQLVKSMADNGAEFREPVLFCNSFQKQKITEIFGYAPDSRTVGGVAIDELLLDFCKLGVVWAPKVPTDTVLIADVSVCSPVFLPVAGKGVLFYEELGRTGASEDGQIFGLVGLDYGPEEFHGKITGLATS